MKAFLRRWQMVLWVGDLVVIGLVTLVGFASHEALAQAGWRLLTTFIPLALAWVIVALPAGLFSVSLAAQGSQWWRPFWGALIAGPLAVLLRALMLEMRPIIPVFALVLTGVSALALGLWRGVVYLMLRARQP